MYVLSMHEFGCKVRLPYIFAQVLITYLGRWPPPQKSSALMGKSSMVNHGSTKDGRTHHR